MKILSNIGYFILEWVWQFIQNMLGLLYSFCLGDSCTGKIFGVNNRCNLYIVRDMSCFCLGKFMFISECSQTKAEEYEQQLGYMVLSRILGPLYIPFIICVYLLYVVLYSWLKDTNTILPHKLDSLANLLYKKFIQKH